MCARPRSKFSSTIENSQANRKDCGMATWSMRHCNSPEGDVQVVCLPTWAGKVDGRQSSCSSKNARSMGVLALGASSWGPTISPSHTPAAAFASRRANRCWLALARCFVHSSPQECHHCSLSESVCPLCGPWPTNIKAVKNGASMETTSVRGSACRTVKCLRWKNCGLPST